MDSLNYLLPVLPKVAKQLFSDDVDIDMIYNTKNTDETKDHHEHRSEAPT